MNRTPSFTLRRVMGARLLAVALSLPVLTWAQAPVLSGPSTARVAQAAVFNGSGFSANAAVSISVTSPAGVEAHYSAVTDANGRFSHAVLPANAGRHVLKVLDSGGGTLVAVDLYVSG